MAIAKYVWEGNTHSASSGQAYYDPLLFALEGGAWKHPMYDGLGSTRQLLDNTTQNVTDEYVYEAFGNLMSSTGSTPNPYRYVGSLGYYQTGSSLQHLGARYYMPEIGRFLQRDPLLRAVGLAWGLGSGVAFCHEGVTHPAHPYVYAPNPVDGVDPSGLFLDPWEIGTIVVYVLLGVYAGIKLGQLLAQVCMSLSPGDTVGIELKPPTDLYPGLAIMVTRNPLDCALPCSYGLNINWWGPGGGPGVL